MFVRGGILCSVKKKTKKRKTDWVVFCLHTIYFYENGCDVLYAAIVFLCHYNDWIPYFCNCVVENMNADDFGFGQHIIRRRLHAFTVCHFGAKARRYCMPFWSEG